MEKLKQVLAQEDTVLFIGSGISMWSGLPSWSELIEELAQFIEAAGNKADLVRAEAKTGDFLQAASYGFDKLTKQQIGDFIRTACRYGVAKPHEIHRKITLLGPRCFVTTNYDDLIEQTLRRWIPDRFFRGPVTNRHLTETAEVVHARAIDFIFKPHGDAADSESIILTREQYRQLLPQGERHAALESLKMLLASRPVVYLGFGLRDPDFMYVRDLLANTYRGGIRDHYAIMADVSDPERDYWRRNYGIHLLNYATVHRADGTRDHSSLLSLLDSLLEEVSASPVALKFDPRAPEVVLALARHAASLARSPKLNPEFKIRVHARTGARRRGHSMYAMPDRFDYSPVEKFLDDGPQRSLLVGLPGAGKTYALRRAAARSAEKLHEACLSEPFDDREVSVPILADLKLYRGSLSDLVSQTLPTSLPFNELTHRFKVKVFVDSFNEMPREYWETSSYESDFAKFVTSIGDASLIIGSRTTDGLTKLGLPTYDLDQIDEDAVTAELQRLGLEIGGRFKREVKSVLQRPFYFRYVTSGAIRLPKEAHPRDFFKVLFENLGKAFASRFITQLDIEESLSIAAYNALNMGQEAFPLSELLSILSTDLRTVGLPIDALEVANWLVSSSILVPHIGGRVAFVHQSVTEYLAATELARRYKASPHILKEKLSLTRWDQALFLTLSLLPPTESVAFLKDVIKADLALALSAVKYVEVGRDETISVLLSEISNPSGSSERFDHKINWLIETDLPITNAHESQLRKLIRFGGSLGGSAARRLVNLKGGAIKEELLRLLVDCGGDFNFCRSIGSALKSFATDEDAMTIRSWADSMQHASQNRDIAASALDDDYEDDDEDSTSGFTSGAAFFMSGLDLSVIRQIFLPQDASEEIPKIHASILCETLRKHDSTVALEIAGELLLRGVEDAASTIYFVSQSAEADSKLSWASFTTDHVEQLESLIKNSGENWSVRALKSLCSARSDLAEELKLKAEAKIGIENALLLHCVSPSDTTPIFHALSKLVEMSEEERLEEPISALDNVELDWAGREELFVKILRERDWTLAQVILGHMIPPSIPSLGNLDIGPIHWWLEWMLEAATTEDYSWWFINLLGGVFGKYLTPEKQDEFVAEFNNPSSRYHRLLQHHVLRYISELTTDAFSEDALSFLLADLSREGSVSSFDGHLLGSTATEQFVSDRLLPLLSGAEPPLSENLRSVLHEAGSRHGRRYVLE